jgi:murein DD-endopeptidase MepM/ murein hydrolase activator NlpD
MLIAGLLDKNKSLNPYDDNLISPLKNPEFYKELSKNTGESFDYYKNTYLMGKTPSAMSEWLTKHLADINSDRNMFETQKLISNGGPNALRDFNIRDRFYTNLGDAESNNPPITKNPTRISPVDNPKTPTGVNAYGAQRNNALGKYEHGGVDYLGKIGDPVYAMQDGKVELRDQPDGLGKYIIIRGKDGSSTIYGHLNKPTVAIGSEVTYGQKIGEMGDSGNAKGTPQLHFEAYSGEPFKKSGRLDPIAFLEGRMLGTPTMQNTAADNKTNVISDVTTSTKENIIDPLVKKFDEMIAAFMAKDTNVVVNTSSDSVPAEPYSEEQLANYKLSGINF